MRDISLRMPSDLVDDVELGADDVLPRIEDPAGGADEGLLEINRIRHDRHDRQQIAVPEEMLRHRRAIGVRDAVALNPADLEMRRLDLERVADPAAEREAGPRVRGV